MAKAANEGFLEAFFWNFVMDDVLSRMMT